jgi:hypothetical protein
LEKELTFFDGFNFVGYFYFYNFINLREHSTHLIFENSAAKNEPIKKLYSFLNGRNVTTILVQTLRKRFTMRRVDFLVRLEMKQKFFRKSSKEFQIPPINNRHGNFKMSSSAQFYCHQCNKNIIPQNFTCPTCKGEFIEELTNETETFVQQIQPQQNQPRLQPQQNQTRQQFSFNFGPTFNGNVSFQSFSSNGTNQTQRFSSQNTTRPQQDPFENLFSNLQGNNNFQSMMNQMMQSFGGMQGGLQGSSNSFQMGDYVFGNMKNIL